jgi:hypothetical protein
MVDASAARSMPKKLSFEQTHLQVGPHVARHLSPSQAYPAFFAADWLHQG